MIGGRRPLSGRKPGDRRVRVDRPHSAYFRYTGPGQLTAKAAASAPTTGLRPAARTRQGRRHRPPARLRGGGRGAPLEEEGARDLQLRRHLVERLCDRGDRAGVRPRAASAPSTSRLPIAIAIAGLLAIVAFSYRQVCIAYPSGGGSYSVSKANIGRIGVAGRGVCAAHRLQPDGGGVDLVRGRADRLGLPGARSRGRAHRPQRAHPDHHRQPSRAPRGGQHLRGPDLPVPGQRAADDRHRRVPDRGPARAGRPRRPRSSRPTTTTAGAVASSSSCARSRPAPSP